MLSEIGFTEQIIGQLAKNHKIPVVLLQPGVYNDTPESTEMNISKGAYPIQSDKIIVWGKIAKNDCILKILNNKKIPTKIQNDATNAKYVLPKALYPSRKEKYDITIYKKLHS